MKINKSKKYSDTERSITYRNQKKWNFVWILAIFLVLLLSFFNQTRLYRDKPFYQFDDFLDFLDSNFIFFINLTVGAFIILITFLVSRFMIKQPWKFHKIAVTILIIITVYSSVGTIEYMIYNRKQYNYCVRILPEGRMFYETDDARIYFRKVDLLKRLDIQLSRYSKDSSLFKEYQKIKSYIIHEASDCDEKIVIDCKQLSLSILGLNPEVKENMMHTGFDSSGFDCTNYQDKLMDAIIEILSNDDIMIYNNMIGKFEDYVSFRRSRHLLGGSGITFCFPSGTILLDHIITLGL
jgi:hypothetical protein